MALPASRQNKPPRKGALPDNANQNRSAWKTQPPPFGPGGGGAGAGAGRAGTPPTSYAAGGPVPGAPPGAAVMQLGTAPGPDGMPRPGDLAHANGNGNGAPTDSFRTDADISHAAGAPRARDLQAWQPDAAVLSASQGPRDDLTFGPGASAGGSWDQFAANEVMFGVTTSFDEDAYTTRIDRTGADFKERERKAQQIANEIMGTASSNPHIAEERNQADDSGVNEEDKFGAVVRGAGAYVPPGARKGLPGGSPAATTPPANTGKTEIPKVKVETPPGTDATQNKLVGTFRDFVYSEKQRLETKRQALVKNEMNKRVADLVSFSKSFKLNKPIPEDLVSILAKDESKQAAIRQKAAADAASASARAIGPNASATSTAAPSPAVAPALAASQTAANLAAAPSQPMTASVSQRLPAQKPKPGAAPPASAAAAPAKTAPKKPMMVIPKIPPFNPNKARGGGPQSASPAQAPEPTSPSATDPAFKLNVNAVSFRPPGAPTSPTKQPASPVAKTADTTPPPPNPFFGTRPVKKTNPAHIKDDFNPFKQAKVAEPNAVSALWQYNGKRFIMAYPTPQPAPMAPVVVPPPHPMPQGAPMPPAPQPYDENAPENAQPRAAYPMVAYYPQYYPGQYGAPPPQHVMAGAPPPAGYIHAGFIQHMPYPPQMHNGHPPPAMYAPQAMPGMPPPQQYLPPPPPPGAYPSPNGGPPGSMPPTPIPAHAYYHPSPQLTHAVPYPMMMAPPPGAPRPHPGYDGAPPGPPAPVQMAGGAHQ